ncbi:MAG: hypothetical protein IKD75_14965 [Prevotella sp.]|nr:hypothetical protein [Prevotella sp.]
MSKHYDEVWQLIESLDDISSQLGDILDGERDRNAKPHLREAMRLIDAAVAELENVDPDNHDDGTPPTGSIVIGKFI